MSSGAVVLEFPVPKTQHSDMNDQSSVELLCVILGKRRAYNNDCVT